MASFQGTFLPRIQPIYLLKLEPGRRLEWAIVVLLVMIAISIEAQDYDYTESYDSDRYSSSGDYSSYSSSGDYSSYSSSGDYTSYSSVEDYTSYSSSDNYNSNLSSEEHNSEAYSEEPGSYLPTDSDTYSSPSTAAEYGYDAYGSSPAYGINEYERSEDYGDNGIYGGESENIDIAGGLDDTLVDDFDDDHDDSGQADDRDDDDDSSDEDYDYDYTDEDDDYDFEEAEESRLVMEAIFTGIVEDAVESVVALLDSTDEKKKVVASGFRFEPEKRVELLRKTPERINDTDVVASKAFALSALSQNASTTRLAKIMVLSVFPEGNRTLVQEIEEILKNKELMQDIVDADPTKDLLPPSSRRRLACDGCSPVNSFTCAHCWTTTLCSKFFWC